MVAFRFCFHYLCSSAAWSLLIRGRGRLRRHLLHQNFGDRHSVGLCLLRRSGLSGDIRLGFVAWHRLAIAARSAVDGRRQALRGSVKVGREGWWWSTGCCRRRRLRLDRFQIDGVRLAVDAEAVAVDLVDDVSDARAAVTGDEDRYDDEHRKIHCRVLFFCQRFCFRDARFCHFCASSNQHRSVKMTPSCTVWVVCAALEVGSKPVHT